MNEESTVAELVKQTNEARELTAAYREKYGDDIKDAAYVDGFAVYAWTQGFMDALRAKNPTLKFGITTDCAKRMASGLLIYRDVWVYRDTDVYALGRIGFLSKTFADVPTYTVYSRLIEHPRIKSDNWAKHVAKKKDLKGAVKLAITKLPPLTPLELAQKSFDTFAWSYKRVVNQAEQNLRTLMYGLVEPEARTDLAIELRALADAGYLFKTSRFRTISKTIAEASEDFTTKKNTKTNAVYVRVASNDHVVITPVEDIADRQKWSPSTYHTDKSSIPEEIVEKVSLLSMVNVESRVNGVGMRVADSLFWVELARGETA